MMDDGEQVFLNWMIEIKCMVPILMYKKNIFFHLERTKKIMLEDKVQNALLVMKMGCFF